MQKCGECKACCKILLIEEVDSKPNEWCQHCNKNGCRIYDIRPKGCREFMCTWLQMNHVGIEMRPDKCGVVFEKFTDNVMMGGTDGKIKPIVQGQIKFFNKEGISVVIVNHNTKTKTNFLANGHTRKFVEDEINDST